MSDGSNPPVESSVESGSGVMAEIYKFIFQKKIEIANIVIIKCKILKFYLKMWELKFFFTIFPIVGGVQHKVGGAHGRRQHVGAVVVLALLF